MQGFQVLVIIIIITTTTTITTAAFCTQPVRAKHKL
jgi:hypothetical protein